MADFEREKIGEIGSIDIIRYETPKRIFREYHCRICKTILANKYRARMHKCKLNLNSEEPKQQKA